MATPAPAVETWDLEKTYVSFGGRQRQRALDGVSLTVPAGTAFGLIGPNGAGKTTFIKLLLTAVRPTGGGLRVLGGDPEDVAVRARSATCRSGSSCRPAARRSASCRRWHG